MFNSAVTSRILPVLLQGSVVLVQHIQVSVVCTLGRAVWGPLTVLLSTAPCLLSALLAMLLVIFKGEGRENIRKLDW